MSAARAGLLATAALVAALAAPAAASAAGAIGIGQFGLAPSPAANHQPRAYFNLQIEPGGSAADTVVLTNLSRATERLRLTISRGVTASNSGSAYEPARGRCERSGCWISGLPHLVTIAAGASTTVPFRVIVPRGTRPAQYLSGITGQIAARPRSVKVGGNRHASARAIIIDQVTVGVAVTVGSPARLRTVLRIHPALAGWIGSTPRLTIGVSNPGQTFARAAGQVTCQSGGRRHSYPVIMNTVLPGGAAGLAVNAKGLATGRIPCTVRLRDSAGHLDTWSGTVRLRTEVLTRTYHPASGVYVSMPESTIPPWAIGLMVLGALIAALLIFMSVRAHKARSPRRLPGTRAARAARRTGRRPA